MAIILDLSQALTSKIVIDGKPLLIEYEGLPMICYSCGRYGHLEETCSLRQPMVPENTISTVPERRPEPEARIPTAEEVNDTKPYGKWMQAPSSGRRFNKDAKKTAEVSYQKVISSGSRYDVLLTCDAESDTPYKNLETSANRTDLVEATPITTTPNPQPSRPKPTKPVKDPKDKPITITQKKQKPRSSPDSIFSTTAYQAVSSSKTPTDQPYHTTVNVPHPKASSKSNPSPPQAKTSNLNTKASHPNDNNKENLAPEPPDPTPPSIGIKIRTPLQLGSYKPKSREPIPTLEEDVLQTITKALEPTLADQDTDTPDDYLEKDVNHVHSDMEH